LAHSKKSLLIAAILSNLKSSPEIAVGGSLLDCLACASLRQIPLAADIQPLAENSIAVLK